MKNIVVAIATLLLITSCASSYNVINPKRIIYQNRQLDTEINFSYKYDVLNERGNKKYAKKETLKGIKIVAIKVVNNTDSSFIFGRDYKVYSGGNPITLLDPNVLQKQFKQNVPVYLLYLLLTPMKLYSGESETPIGYVVGPGLTIGNMAVAGGANKNFKNEIQSTYLNGRQINSGETVYGLIGIYDQGYNPLTLK